MEYTKVLFTKLAARREGKSAFYFSRYNFPRIRARSNTHYCFHCGGYWGFTPNKDVDAWNSKDHKATLRKSSGVEVEIREVVADPELEALLVDEPGYPRRKKEDSGYEKWLEYTAYCTFGPELVALAEKRGWTIRRWDPMEHHDPKTHADAVVGDVDKYPDAASWLEATRLPPNFPYVVTVT